MKIEIDLEITPRTKRAVKWLFAPLAAVVGSIAIAHASWTGSSPDPATWVKDQSPVSASALSANLSELDGRVSALEKASAKTDTLAFSDKTISPTGGQDSVGHTMTLPSAGQYVVTYTAAVKQSGVVRPDLLYIRLDWGSAAGQERAVGGVSGAPSSSTWVYSSVVTLSELVTVTGAGSVQVELKSDGGAGGNVSVESGQMTYLKVK